MSAGSGRADHWQRPAAPQPLPAASIAAQIGACEARKSPLNEAAREGNSERRRASPSARTAATQAPARSASPVLAASATAASGASRGGRSSARGSHARSPVNAPRKSPVPADGRASGRSPPNRPASKSSANGAAPAESARAPAQPAGSVSSLGSEFLNMSPATCLREINPEIQDVLRADRGLQSEVEQQKEFCVYPLMTSSTASFITVDNDSDNSDSDTQTEPLPYVKAGAGLVHLEHEGGYTIAKIDTLPDEALEELIAQMSLALNRRKAVSNLGASGSTSNSKTLPVRSSKLKDSSATTDKKFTKRTRSDPIQSAWLNSKHMDLEVASITSGGHSSDEHDRWRDNRASGPHDKMFRSQFLLRDPENGHLCHVNYPNRRTVIDGCRQLRRVKPVAVSVRFLFIPRLMVKPQFSTPDRERVVASLTSPRSAFDDVSSQNSESSIPPPL